MSLYFNRFINFFSKEVDAYSYQVKTYDSIGDYVHDDGYITTRIYIPCYELYIHYYDDGKRFVSYKSSEKFNENDKDYTNVRKIKVNSSFINYMYDVFDMNEDVKKWSNEHKQYFDSITKN
jgi:hypothetical protein